MSGKSCGIRENTERQQYMLGSNMYTQRTMNQQTREIVTAIKQNRQQMSVLNRKTEHLEQSLLTQRSLEENNKKRNNFTKEVEDKFTSKLDLVNGEFKQQMKLMKDYIKVLEQKIIDLENTVVKKTPTIPKKENTHPEPPSSKQPEKPKEKPKESENVTLEIKEK